MCPVVGLATLHPRLSCCGIVLQRFGYGHFGNPTLTLDLYTQSDGEETRVFGRNDVYTAS